MNLSWNDFVLLTLERLCSIISFVERFRSEEFNIPLVYAWPDVAPAADETMEVLYANQESNT